MELHEGLPEVAKLASKFLMKEILVSVILFKELITLVPYRVNLPERFQ